MFLRGQYTPTATSAGHAQSAAPSNIYAGLRFKSLTIEPAIDRFEGRLMPFDLFYNQFRQY